MDWWSFPYCFSLRFLSRTRTFSLLISLSSRTAISSLVLLSPCPLKLLLTKLVRSYLEFKFRFTEDHNLNHDQRTQLDRNLLNSSIPWYLGRNSSNRKTFANSSPTKYLYKHPTHSPSSRSDSHQIPGLTSGVNVCLSIRPFYSRSVVIPELCTKTQRRRAISAQTLVLRNGQCWSAIRVSN